jgi:CheY-like chemotaxis protein
LLNYDCLYFGSHNKGFDMPVTQPILPHLPFLRRYARALTGSQASGDSYVRAVLTALLADEHILEEKLPRRVALYKLFHRIWMSSSNEYVDLSDARSPSIPQQRLADLAADNRAILLLTAVESFTMEEAGQIVDKTPDEIEMAIVDAQAKIENTLKTRVLIIEDEPIIALDLENLVVELGHDVIGVTSTREQAVKAALENKPGLVLADINLGAGGSGIDAVADILNTFDIPIIFITAYPEKLLTGERPEPTYLVSKPFSPDTVQATIGQALFFHRLGSSKHSSDPD